MLYENCNLYIYIWFRKQIEFTFYYRSIIKVLFQYLTIGGISLYGHPNEMIIFPDGGWFGPPSSFLWPVHHMVVFFSKTALQVLRCLRLYHCNNIYRPNGKFLISLLTLMASSQSVFSCYQPLVTEIIIITSFSVFNFFFFYNFLFWPKFTKTWSEILRCFFLKFHCFLGLPNDFGIKCFDFAFKYLFV